MRCLLNQLWISIYVQKSFFVYQIRIENTYGVEQGERTVEKEPFSWGKVDFPPSCSFNIIRNELALGWSCHLPLLIKWALTVIHVDSQFNYSHNPQWMLLTSSGPTGYTTRWWLKIKDCFVFEFSDNETNSGHGTWMKAVVLV